MFDEWDPCAWAADVATAVAADEALVAQVHEVCASPPWHEPQWAKRLAIEVPRLATGACGARALPYMPLEDVIAELQATLITRSQSAASRWDPTRGRTTWTGWACMVMRSRFLNLVRGTNTPTAKCISFANEMQVEDWSADSHPYDEDDSPWLSSKGKRPSRAGQRRTGRPMGRPRKHPKPHTAPAL